MCSWFTNALRDSPSRSHTFDASAYLGQRPGIGSCPPQLPVPRRFFLQRKNSSHSTSSHYQVRAARLLLVHAILNERGKETYRCSLENDHHSPPQSANSSRSLHTPAIVDGFEESDDNIAVVEQPLAAKPPAFLVSREEAQQQLLELLQSGDDHTEEFNPDDKFVEGFAKEFTLLPHQIIGRNFMRSREAADKKKYGGILADDMGILTPFVSSSFGKTIMTAAHISDNRPKASDRSEWSRATLIVVPASLVCQWAAELKEKVPDLKVLEHAGSSRPRDTAKFAPYDAVITSYQTLGSEYNNSDEVRNTLNPELQILRRQHRNGRIEETVMMKEAFLVAGLRVPKRRKLRRKPNLHSAKPKHSALMQQRWYRVVLDEAHNIKNRNANISEAAAQLSSKYRWALTGTPIQDMISNPISDCWTTRAMQRVQIILKAIMLRRTKASTLNDKPILDLPPRNVKVVECEFDASERWLYQTLEGRMSMMFKDMDRNGRLLRLRQTCDHPSLVWKDLGGDLEEQLRDKENDDEDFRDANSLTNDRKPGAPKCTICQERIPPRQKTQTCDDCAGILMESRRIALADVNNDQSANTLSAKIRKMHQLLLQIWEESDEQDKTIIFSQFTGMLDLVGNFFNEKNIKFTRFDGNMDNVQKDASIKLIKESPTVRIILISLKAGGLGLNLTCCNRVILLDPWWNPAIEEQAFDRTHRFGQKKPVQIYKLTIPHTVEERIIEIQEEKRELAMAVLSGNKISATKLTLRDLRKLFGNEHDHEDEED
ncbi:P-loop containing nucleoside triphosphate hydrolase protein [Auriculariales sp. MPI-PUGE-AT-0066]|nr:P-loop containing nucleoside triphosphate hydrolase protein [Auriculariales sp. MPI-PUGE-AT-0066]